MTDNTFHYICGTDYEHEIDHPTQPSLDYFDSLAALKAAKTCWPQCGVVWLELDPAGEEVSHQWVVPKGYRS
jgi:hypothetical protein